MGIISGVAVGLLSTFRLIGGAISTAIYTSIQSNKFASILPGMVLSAVKTSNFTGPFSQILKAAEVNSAAAYAAVPNITTETIRVTELAVKQAHVKAYALIYLVAIAFGCVAIISATSIKGIDESQRTSEVAAHLENDNNRILAKDVEHATAD